MIEESEFEGDSEDNIESRRGEDHHFHPHKRGKSLNDDESFDFDELHRILEEADEEAIEDIEDFFFFQNRIDRSENVAETPTLRVSGSASLKTSPTLPHQQQKMLSQEKTKRLSVSRRSSPSERDNIKRRDSSQSPNRKYSQNNNNNSSSISSKFNNNNDMPLQKTSPGSSRVAAMLRGLEHYRQQEYMAVDIESQGSQYHHGHHFQNNQQSSADERFNSSINDLLFSSSTLSLGHFNNNNSNGNNISFTELEKKINNFSDSTANRASLPPFSTDLEDYFDQFKKIRVLYNKFKSEDDEAQEED